VILYQRGTAVVRIDPWTGAVRARIPLPGVGTSITVGAGAVWVMREGKVWRIDPATNQIVATIPVPSGADDIAADATGVWVVRNQFAVISRHGDSELIRIDSATNRIVGAPIRVPCGFGSLAVGHGALWVTTGRGIGIDSLVQIDPRTGHQVGEPMSIPHVEKVAAGPCGVWVSRWERPKGKSHVGLLTPVVP
jgi:DNA-binding beta-propeller fold protein YncE